MGCWTLFKYTFFETEFITTGTYLGCYNDDSTNRDLSPYSRNADGSYISNEYCAFECGRKNYKYAGSQLQ